MYMEQKPPFLTSLNLNSILGWKWDIILCFIDLVVISWGGIFSLVDIQIIKVYRAVQISIEKGC